MIKEDERKALVDSIFSVKNILTNMGKVIKEFDNKSESVSKILTKSGYVRAETELKIQNLVRLNNKSNEINKVLLEIENVEDNISDVFKMFLEKEFIIYNWLNLHLASDFTTRRMLGLLAEIDNRAIQTTDLDIIGSINHAIDSYESYFQTIEDKISNYQIFNQIKEIASNIVMIGANGSGKSTFSRQLDGKLDSNVSILAAQHLLSYRKTNSISIVGNEIEMVQKFQKQSKLSGDANFMDSINKDMGQLITALIAEHTRCTDKYYTTDNKQISILTQTIEIWHELIEHRELCYERGTINAKEVGESPYDFERLSDGEKAVFYYIGHILLAMEKSYIIIDEPENHLNMAICNKLWDALERKRSDCKFIYLTHNIDFAVSRGNTTKIWNKKFAPPNQWDFEILDMPEDIPETLLLSLLGSRKPVCFCEGDRGSKDFKVYSVLFPQYTIYPVGGHLDVLYYTKTYNSSQLFHNRAIGIIDGDYHLEEQINTWKEKNVYTIPINEIENVLCDCNIIDKAASYFFTDEESKERYYDKFWYELQRDLQLQGSKYVNTILNNKFKENFLKAKNDIEELKTELNTITSVDEIDKIYTEYIQKLKNYIREKDYDAALRSVNFKGKLTGDIAKVIIQPYADKVIHLLAHDEELRDVIIKKYYQDVPLE